MTPQDINDLVIRYQNEENQDLRDSIFDKIYKSQEGMIVSFISTSSHRLGEAEDLKQELLLATVECINRFKEGKGASFNTYLFFYLKRGRWIWSNKNKLVKVQKSAKKKDSVYTYLDKPLEDGTLSQKDLLKDKFNWESFDEISDLNDKLNELSELDKIIFVSRLEGYSFEEIGIKTNLQRAKISEKYHEIFNKLQN